MKHTSLSSMMVWLLLGGIVVYGCMLTGSIFRTAAPSASPAPALIMADFPGVGTLDLTVAQDGTLYVALGIDSAVFVGPLSGQRRYLYQTAVSEPGSGRICPPN